MLAAFLLLIFWLDQPLANWPLPKRQRANRSPSADAYLRPRGPPCIAIAAGRSVRNTPNPTFARRPYAALNVSGTKPTDSEPPTPGFRPRQVVRNRV